MAAQASGHSLPAVGEQSVCVLKVVVRFCSRTENNKGIASRRAATSYLVLAEEGDDETLTRGVHCKEQQRFDEPE
jgi:hypothetical protein